MKRLCVVLLGLVAACDRPAPAPPNQVQAQGVVDSIFPVEEEIRRFKAQHSGPFPTELVDGATSREALARGFVEAIERRDTAALRALIVHSDEFIELYYPHSQYTRPPYKQSPELLWFLLQQHSEKGIARALERFAGRPAGYRGLECANKPVIQEKNRLWDCQVRWALAPGKPDPVRLFGPILERDGQFKFLSYANDF